MEVSADLNISEVIQAGDVFLLRFDCPLCKEPNLEGFPIKTCSVCCGKLDGYRLEIPKRYRVLAGTRRKKCALSKHTVQVLLDQSDNECAYCGDEISLSKNNFEIDHILPLCVGGSNNLSNLVACCVLCNALAGRYVFNSFLEKKIFLLKRRNDRLIQPASRWKDARR